MHLYLLKSVSLYIRKVQIYLLLILVLLIIPLLLKFFTTRSALATEQHYALASITGVPIREIIRPLMSRRDLIKMLMAGATTTLEKFGVEWEYVKKLYSDQRYSFACVYPSSLPQLQTLEQDDWYFLAKKNACWIVKDEINYREITTPIMHPTDESYYEITQVMKRFNMQQIEFNKNDHAVHVHVNFPRSENMQKLLSLFARLEFVLNVMNSRSECYVCFSKSSVAIKNLCNWSSPEQSRRPIFENNYENTNLHFDHGYMLRTRTPYGTVEFRSVIDLTWNPEVNVQNVLLSQTIVKIANMESKFYIEILKTIEEIIPIEKFMIEACHSTNVLRSRKLFPRPTESQIMNVLQLLEDIAKTDTFFTGAITQPNFKLLQTKFL